MKRLLFLTVLNVALLTSSCLAQIRAIDSLQNLLKTDKADTNKVNHLNALGWALMHRNPDTAIVLCNQALQIITPLFSSEFISVEEGREGNKVKSLRANTLGNLGICYSLKSDFTQALEYYFTSLKLYEELKNKKGMV